MKVLIFGLADSIWVKEYIENVLDDENVREIAIVSYKNSRYVDFYKSKRIKVICIPSREKSKILSFFHAKRIIKSEIDYVPDLVHIHFAELGMMIFALSLIKKAPFSCVTFWGSDLLRNKNIKFKFMNFILNKVDVIQLVSQNMLGEFNRQFGSRYTDKVKILDFGNPMYNVIDKVLESSKRDECKLHFGLPIERKIIHIGYNGIRQQNHLRLISAISKMSGEIKKNIFLVLHFGYGNNDSAYVAEVKRELNKSGLEYKMILDYFDKEEMSRFRLSADLFVYAQTTDALAGSVVEYLYANVLCIIPSWLDYKAIEDNNISFVRYSDFAELPEVISRTIKDESNGMNLDNRYALANWNSWGVLAAKWKKMLRIK